MSKKKTYNEGVESGLKVAKGLVEKESEAIDYLKEKVDIMSATMPEIAGTVDKILEDENDKEVQKLFGICNPDRPVDLKDHDQKLLLNLVASLSLAGANSNQRVFYNNLRHHLNIQGYEPDPNCDYKTIENLESVKSIKVIAKALRAYLFLADNCMDGVYFYDDSIFSHFELRSFDDIDATIELLYALFGVDGIIEMYGDFEEADDFSFIEIEDKEYLPISNECAQVYFKDMFVADKSRKYVETASYVVYNAGKRVYALNKKTAERQTVIEINEDGEMSDMMSKHKITSYADMVYFILGQDIYYYDLDTGKKKVILSVEQKVDDEGKPYEVTWLFVYKAEKLIFKNGHRFYVVDLRKSETSMELDVNAEGRCFLRGEYLYHYDMDSSLDDFNGKDIMVKYRIKRTNILTGVETNVSVPFGKHKFEEIYELKSEGIFQHYYYVVFGHQSIGSMENKGFHCYYFNLNDAGMAKEQNFSISHNLIYQIEQYQDVLIYIDAGDQFSLIRHSILNNKKKVLLKQYGTEDKASLSDKYYLGKEEFQHPQDYMRLGPWLWTKMPEKFSPEIIYIWS